MAIIHGSLARSGKVKYQTPRVPRTSDETYQGGCKKYKQKSSTNINYSAGAQRLEKNFGEALQNHDDQCKKNIQRCDWVETRMKVKQTEPVLLNSFHKFNSEKGFDRVEWIRVKVIETTKKKAFRNARYGDARNHKKWHRNHPVEGFYQKRVVDAEDLEEYDSDDDGACDREEIISFTATPGEESSYQATDCVCH